MAYLDRRSLSVPTGDDLIEYAATVDVEILASHEVGTVSCEVNDGADQVVSRRIMRSRIIASPIAPSCFAT